MNKYLKTLLLSALFVSTISLQAQKVGYVNTDVILAALPEVEVANTEIETLKSQFMKKGQEMVTTLQAKYAELEGKRNELSPNKLQEEAAILEEERATIQAFDQNSQLKIQEKTQALYLPIQEKVNAAIKAVAEENEYVYIFDTTLGTILYADEESDVSEMVLAKLKS